MIPPETSVKLKRGLGPNYYDAVKAKLMAKGEAPKTGHPYSKQYISMVLKGERHVPAVEETLFEVYSENVKQIFIDAPELGVPIPEPAN